MPDSTVLAANGLCARVLQIASGTGLTTTSGWVTRAARTTSSNSEIITGVGTYSSAFVVAHIVTGSGTSPTLDLYIQQEVPDGLQSNWVDIAAFTQITSTSEARRAIGMTSGGTEEFAVQSQALTAATFRTVPFGQSWRLYWKIGGTSPSWTFAVYADFMS